MSARHKGSVLLAVVAAGSAALGWGTADVAARPRARVAVAAALASQERGEKPDLAPREYRPATEAESKAAAAAIESQLKAFRDDDYEKAARYQSAGLRENFPTLDHFRAMMQRSYPQFASYKSVKFGEARADKKGDQVEVQVTVTGKDNVTIRALYQMVREKGEYKVGSVVGGTPPKLSPKDVV